MCRGHITAKSGPEMERPSPSEMHIDEDWPGQQHQHKAVAASIISVHTESDTSIIGATHSGIGN